MDEMLCFMLLLSLAGKVAAVELWVHSPVLAVVCFFGSDLLIFYHLFVPSAQGICRVFTHFETREPEIWLTIDDGPDPEDTPRILDLLDSHQAQATFFLIGERAARYPELVAEILRRGHEVGHHTHTHPMRFFWCATFRRLNAELDDGLTALQRAGARPQWFRSPVGIKNIFLGRALASRGLQFVAWNVRSYDARSQDPSAVLDGIMRRVQPGSILVMHEGPAMDSRVRVKALALVLGALAERRLECVLPVADQLR